MEQNQEYAVFGRQVGYSIGAHLGILVLGLLQISILTKGLGVTLYGTWSLINVTILLIVPFALLSFNASIVRFLTAEKDKNKIRDDFFSAIFIVLIMATVLSFLLFFFADQLAAAIFKDVNSSFYIKLASILILLNSLHFLPLAFFRMRRNIGLHAILTVIYHGFQVGLIAAAMLLGYELAGVITALIISGILFIVVTMFIILRQIGFQLPKFSRMKSYLKWGVPLTPNIAILWLILSSDRYIVSYFMGVTAAGIYSAAYAIGNYASFVALPLGTVLYPTIIKSYDEGDICKTKAYLKYSIRYLMMITIPSAFGISILATPLLQILTASDFISGSTVLPYIAFGTMLYGFYQIPIWINHLVNKTHLTVRLLGTAAITNIALNFVLIPRIGLLGAAVATLIAYGVLGILTLAVTRKYLKFDLSLPFIAKSTFASAVMALCIWLIHPQSLVSVILSVLLGALIYFAVLLLIRGLSKQEITFFTNFIKNNLRKAGASKE